MGLFVGVKERPTIELLMILKSEQRVYFCSPMQTKPRAGGGSKSGKILIWNNFGRINVLFRVYSTRNKMNSPPKKTTKNRNKNNNISKCH